MITSSANPKVKLVRALARRRARAEAKQFVVEGVRLVEEAAAAGVAPVFVLHTEQADQESRSHALLDRLRAQTPEVFSVDDAIMEAVSSTETPQGILAVVPFVDLPLPPQLRFVLVLDAVRDPGNTGTILRSARAAGVNVVLFAPGTADPYNDKVIRSGMGAQFFVPVRVMHRWEELADALRGIPNIYLADAHGALPYTRADWSRPVALIVGGEAQGASADAQRIATARVSIPMRGGAESLNAAMAATVLLFQAVSAQF